MKMIKILGLTLAAAGMMTITAQATPITGSIDIGAFDSSVVIDKTLNTVTFVDSGNLPGGNALVGNASGGFLPYILSQANYVNFSYDPLVVANPIWSLVSGLVSFNLTSITSINEGGLGLVLAGTGVINAVGYDPTPGTWSFSADTANGGNFTFSSQTTANVPDGGSSLILLGGAILGLFGIARKSLRIA